MRSKKMFTILLLALVVCSGGIGRAAPMGTAFTYQARLLDSDNVADGIYDFRFKLFDNSGILPDGQIGKTLDVNDIDVIDGYFTVVLDFSIDVFNGDARWLDIGIRPGKLTDPNDYTPLFPRQQVTPSPYSIYAGKAGDLSLPYSKIVASAESSFLVRNTGSGKAIQGIGENNDGVVGGCVGSPCPALGTAHVGVAQLGREGSAPVEEAEGQPIVMPVSGRPAVVAGRAAPQVALTALKDGQPEDRVVAALPLDLLPLPAQDLLDLLLVGPEIMG